MSFLGFTSCRYFHKGSLAYVGGDQAVMDIPTVGPIFGREAGIMWKGYETFAQVNTLPAAAHCGCAC
jgi:NADH dehydrogenase FAD-containing subunit